MPNVWPKGIQKELSLLYSKVKFNLKKKRDCFKVGGFKDELSDNSPF